MMFGYACDETPELMPLPIMLAHKLFRELHQQKTTNKMPHLRPDAKSQITVEYNEDNVPQRIHTVVLSSQHCESISTEKVKDDLMGLIKQSLPLLDSKTQIFINPTGRFVIGGPAGDSGLTGRKIMVDTYGGMAHHRAEGFFQGKTLPKLTVLLLMLLAMSLKIS